MQQKVFVKICGITNIVDAQVAVESGADLLGFIFYPKSSRYVIPQHVAEIIRTIRSDSRLQTSSIPRFVGVFVNETPARIQQIVEQTDLDLVQLHGDETPDILHQVQEMLQGELQANVFKAVRPADSEAAHAQAARFANPDMKDGPNLLVDTYDPHAYGGTGHKSDWHVGAELAAQYPGLLLAGGLTPENVSQAIHAVQPWGVDIASGVEVAPGRKDHEKVRAFVTQARL